METKRLWVETQEEEEKEEMRMMEATINFRMRLPVGQHYVNNPQNRKALMFAAENKLRDLLSRHDHRSLEHIPSEVWRCEGWLKEVYDEED
jgi:hypothetical protein